jgi:hypothetical protein
MFNYVAVENPNPGAGILAVFPCEGWRTRAKEKLKGTTKTDQKEDKDPKDERRISSRRQGLCSHRNCHQISEDAQIWDISLQ